MPTSTSEQAASTGSSCPTSEENASPKYTTATPLLINIGKVKSNKAKKIKKGRGSVLSKVEKAVQIAAEHLEGVNEETVMVPVVMLYERKGKKKKKRWW